MTVQGAMRYDHAWSYFPEQTVGPVRFFPTAVTYPRTTGVEGYNDLWPRGGVAYDLFGTGKTSIKFNFGRYLEAAQNGGLVHRAQSDRRASTTTTSRTWTDTNRNFVADCNLQNPAAQDLGATGGDLLRPECERELRDAGLRFDVGPGPPVGVGRAFGRLAVGRVGAARSAASCRRRMGYQRRWLVNSLVTDNRARSAADHTLFGVTIPTDSRLPGGGGGVLKASTTSRRRPRCG